MIVKRQNNEISVKFSAEINISKIQTILDYLRYEELTAKSNATENSVNELLNEVKEERWENSKKEIGIND